MTPAQPTPAAPRWAPGRRLWITFAVLALLSISMYEVLSSPSPAGPSVVFAADCGGSVHDAMCEAGLAAAAQVARPRVGPDADPHASGTLAAVVLLALVALTAATGRDRWPGGSPPGTPVRQTWGRHLLIDIGIARI